MSGAFLGDVSCQGKNPYEAVTHRVDEAGVHLDVRAPAEGLRAEEELSEGALEGEREGRESKGEAGDKQPKCKDTD